MRNTKFGIAAVFVLILFGLIYVSPAKEWAISLYEWGLANPKQSMVAFVLAFVLWVVLALPAVLLALTGGFVFGFPMGMSLVLLGHIGGSTLAFLISKKLGRDFVEGKLGYNEKFHAIDLAIKDSSFSIVFLARLSMILPYNLLNYVFGLTSVGLKTYVVSSFLGMLLPFGLWVFLGTTADDFAAILNGEIKLAGRALLVPGFGLLALVVIVGFVINKAKQSLRGRLKEYDREPNTDDGGSPG